MNAHEAAVGPSMDTVILDLAIAGASLGRIARYLGANIEVVRERYEALLRDQCELINCGRKQSGNQESSSKKNEKHTKGEHRRESRERANSSKSRNRSRDKGMPHPFPKPQSSSLS
jgi:hypothetical protein